jgi:hypothetical protein
MNLLPALTENAPPVQRKLFWRYKANWQRAVRDGDYKYLKILDNENRRSRRHQRIATRWTSARTRRRLASVVGGDN